MRNSTKNRASGLPGKRTSFFLIIRQLLPSVSPKGDEAAFEQPFFCGFAEINALFLRGTDAWDFSTYYANFGIINPTPYITECCKKAQLLLFSM